MILCHIIQYHIQSYMKQQQAKVSKTKKCVGRDIKAHVGVCMFDIYSIFIFLAFFYLFTKHCHSHTLLIHFFLQTPKYLMINVYSINCNIILQKKNMI